MLRVGGILVAAAVLVSSAAAAKPREYAAVALNILPPGEAGDVSFGRNSTDQAKLYDALTPKQGRITASDLRRYFKSARFGLDGAKPTRRERPRRGVRILRDKWDVPHVYGRTRADVMFGDGWATLEDRGLLLALIRGPSALGALDVPGYDPLTVALSGRQFTMSAQAREFILQQVALVRARGARGRALLRDVNAFVAGMNAFAKKEGTSRWSLVDVIAAGSLIAAAEGVGGGDEVRRAEFMDALQTQLGAARGTAVWNDLRERNDPEAPTSLPTPFPYGPDHLGASVSIRDGSFEPALPSTPSLAFRRLPSSASNALLVSGFRSATGHPLFVAGPQVAYFYPELFMEADLHGGGIDARGIVFPGIPYVVIGRGIDYAWSATTSHSDIIDEYAETLCGDDAHYVYKGECVEMGTFDAGTLSNPTQELVFHMTVHGPVIGYAQRLDGTRIAISRRRSTYGREAMSLFAFSDLDSNRVTSAQSFFRVMNQEEFAFNWFYADDRDIALFSAGRLPIRPGDTGDFPVLGTGDYEWRGFEPLARHAHGTSRTMILNWNNKPAPQYAGGDDRWSWGSIQRVTLLRNALPQKRKLTLTDVVAAMNKAATQDLRCELLVPTIARVLAYANAPSERDAAAAKTLSLWVVNGCDRLDRDLDGKIDDAGAAMMDELWPRVARTVLGDVLGPLTPRLERLVEIDNHPYPGGSSWDDGWYGYVDKDLRTLLGEPVRGAFDERYCGRGVLATCAGELWQDVDAAADALSATQGPDPFAWRASALPERIRFTPGLLPLTMRWTNRPTFQQVVTFDRHRHR